MKTNHITPKPVSAILLYKNLSKRVIEFLSSYFSEKYSNGDYKIRKSGLPEFFLLILKYNRNHQYNIQ